MTAEWRTEHLACMFCGVTASGKLPDLERAGWEWFSGWSPERKAVCPKCKSTRSKDWSAYVKQAQARPPERPEPVTAYKKRTELVALLREVLDAHDAPLSEGVSVLLPRELIEQIRKATK